jgi:hypothetical protein
VDSQAAGTSSSNGSSAPKRSFFQDTQPGQQTTTANSSSSSNAPSNSSASSGDSPQVALLEKMLKNPKMQELLYPYLPEPMRNPETFEWMLNNPEYRVQLEKMMEQQRNAFTPEMTQMLGQMDLDNNDWDKQLNQMGLTPDEVVSKIMSEPDLAAAFAKPEVQQAIMDITQNPLNVMKYQDQPEVMKVFEKMATLFPQGPDGGVQMPPSQP